MPFTHSELALRLRPIFDSARDALVLLEPGGDIVLANLAAHMLARGAEPLEGRPFWDAPWWGERPQVREALRGAVEKAAAGERAFVEVDYNRPDGVSMMEVAIGPVFLDGEEKPSLLRCESHDIGAHRKLAAALQKAIREYEAVLASTQDPVITIDVYGTMLSVSRSIERIFGYTPAEVIGKNVSMLMPEPHQSAHDGYMANYRRTGDTHILNRTREFDALHKNGHRFPIELSVARVDVPGQEQPLFTGIIHDITDRKNAERLLKENAAALERSNKDLEQFAYVASHDLQEPLRMVGSFAGLLARRYKGRLDSEADEFIAYIVDGAERMKMLIEDLLAYSRVSTKGRRPEPVSMQTIVNRVLADLRGAIESAGAEVVVHEMPEVKADPTQLHQLMLNLIGNAIKFRGTEPPRVTVSAEPLNGFWCFSVRDNGIGIDPRYADRIFHIFERLHAAADYPGTGIGLAICNKIVERHGGKIWVESSPGRGSDFRFTLPREDPQ